MNKTAFSEEAIRQLVRDEIRLLGLPAGLTTIARACMMIVRWAQKTKEKLKAELKEEP